MKVNFAACAVVFDGYERCSKKNYKSSRIQTQQPNVNVLSKKKRQVIKQRGDFGCNTRSKTLLVKLLSQYLKMETQLSTIRMMLTSILVDCFGLQMLKKDVTVLAEGTYIYYFVLIEKGDWGNLHESRQ